MKLISEIIRSTHIGHPLTGGVWIETGMFRSLPVLLSHPLTGGCGLKLALRKLNSTPWGHPLTGGCGLKHCASGCIDPSMASPPHGGVWIETNQKAGDAVRGRVTPSRGGVD